MSTDEAKLMRPVKWLRREQLAVMYGRQAGKSAFMKLWLEYQQKKPIWPWPGDWFEKAKKNVLTKGAKP